jgi:hypothetical protein
MPLAISSASGRLLLGAGRRFDFLVTEIGYRR